MNRKTGLFSSFFRRRVGKDRSGYTLLEILVAVSLMLMLMYAVAAIFGRVGTIMNQTQGAMTLASGLRDTCRRLEADLRQVSVPLVPPRNSRNNEGYFSFVEGMGGSFERILHTHTEITGGTNFSSADIAWDFERSGGASISVAADSFTSSGTLTSDTSVGDTDDILMFTAKAPAGQLFRGRFLSPVYEGGKIRAVSYDIIESEYAEIIWFLRGTTLYRRVLLIIPQEKLEEGLKAADWLAWTNGYHVEPYEVKPGATSTSRLTATWTPYSGSYSRTPISPVRLGYGFFNFFDVSVHLERFDNPTALSFDRLRPNDATGTYVYYNAAGGECRELERVVANTLGDLSNRKNRYGYWNSVCGTASDNANYVDVGSMLGLGKLHGNYGAWYWLRLPTLQESAAFRPSTSRRNGVPDYIHSFRAGIPFGGGNLDASYWRGINQTLEAAYAPNTSLTTATNRFLIGNDLPLTPTFDHGAVQARYPFLDFWNQPNCWEQVSQESGDLLYAQAGFNSGDFASASQANLNSNTRSTDWSGGSGQVFSQDVILTNVLSFNVRVWDENTRQFVEMGSQFSLGCYWDHLTLFDHTNPRHESYLNSFSKDFKTIGFYRPFNYANNKTVNNDNTGSHILAPFLPAVYDTWTEQYELEWLYHYKINNGTTYPPEPNISDIPSEGSVSSVQIPHFPPPYDLPLKAVQVELRVFDPKLKIIRNMTFQVDFPVW